MTKNRRAFLTGVFLLVVFYTKTSFGQGCNYVDLGILLDSSGSIVDEEAWGYEQSFVKQIISRMHVGPDEDHVGMLTFSSKVKILFNLSTFYDLTDMYSSIDNTRALDQNTYTGLGLRTLREVTFNVTNGDRPNVPNVAIVITDGKSNVFPEQTITEARNLKATGARVLVVGITSSINITELQTIASNISDVIIVDTYANLTKYIVDDIVGKACIPDYGPAVTSLPSTTLTTPRATTLPATTSTSIVTRTVITPSDNTSPRSTKSENNPESSPIAVAVGVRMGVGVPVIVAIIVTIF